MKTVRILSAVLVLALIVGGAYWLFARPTPVQTVAPRRGEAAQIVYATGVVEPRVWAKVTPLIRERIVSLCDCEGEPVEFGAELARLDSREAEATLAELKARQKLAAAEHERQLVLAGRNVASVRDLDQARSELAQLEALIAGQTAKLENYVLRSPMQGLVLRKDGEVGEIVDPGTILFWVGEPKPLWVIADVNEEDIPQVAVGQKALLRSDAFPGQALPATVDSITPKGDPVAKTYRVRLALPDDTPVRIGMTVDVNIVNRTVPNALLIPTEAVNGDAVFTVDADNRARRRTLEIGIRGIRDFQVLSGLAEGDRVITPFPETLADGARVAPEGG
ncbi:efflux RND transporter periplasmic adaptor subunit [Inquilinus limosus]|uniref:efflux RND transporter periplasmic adaptor subunit n=1 Tax=Inquilinus limosus TaxID=171674 RepID=UPI000422240C|nr:efflux RND transporter periplasmic adaptor subunit [Inquilinus limosus]